MTNKFMYLSVGMLLLSGLAAAQQKPFTIKGKMQGKTGAYLYLAYDGGEEKRTIDSALIQDGQFSFSGKLSGPSQATLMMDRNGRSYDKYAQLYIVPANMQLSVVYDRFDEAALTGSPVQKEADELKKMRAPVMAKIKPLSDAYTRANTVYIEAMKEKKDEAVLASLKETANKAKDAMDPLREELDKVDEAFMDKHPSSFVTASLLRFAVSRLTFEEAESRYNKLSPAVKATSLGKDIRHDVDGLRKGSPGAPAFVFASKELRGEQLSLADYKGKYVLLDFWASWCVPCRKGNPHLLALYAKYKDKGLEIIGVSDDDSKPEAWVKAVEQDKIGVWKHVLRGLKRDPNTPLGFDRSASISDQYGIHTLPTKVLVDPNGVIIGRYGGGGESDEAMDKKLSDIFGG